MMLHCYIHLPEDTHFLESSHFGCVGCDYVCSSHEKTGFTMKRCMIYNPNGEQQHANLPMVLGGASQSQLLLD